MARYAFELLKGYGVASGRANNSKFPAGTIALQRPFFKRLGLDLTPYFTGTLNIALIDYKSVELINWDYEFNQVKWLNSFPAENFTFAHCKIQVKELMYKALIYQPNKETKTAHFQPDNCLEVLAPFIDGINVGERGELVIDECYLAIEQI